MGSKQDHSKLTRELVQLCEQLVRALVKDPEQVSVSYQPRKETLRILVSDRDRGLVIGRGGQNLQALEHSLQAAVYYLQTGTETAKPTSHSIPYGLPSLEVRVNEDSDPH